MDVPAGGTLATRLEQSWFGGPNAPGSPPSNATEQQRRRRHQRSSDASDPGSGPMGSSDAGHKDEDAVETSSAAAESIGRSVRWAEGATATLAVAYSTMLHLCCLNPAAFDQTPRCQSSIRLIYSAPVMLFEMCM